MSYQEQIAAAADLEVIDALALVISRDADLQADDRTALLLAAGERRLDLLFPLPGGFRQLDQPNEFQRRDGAMFVGREGQSLDSILAETNAAPAPMPDAPLALVQVASARLTVDGWDVTGLDRSIGISGAFLLDTDLVWIGFAIEQSDIDYIVVPPDGVQKFTDHIEVTRPAATSISLIVQRLQ
jgi:hypothetical protein